MPNYCDFKMKVRGYPESVNEFVKLIQADYSHAKGGYGYKGRHLFRVFEADVVEETIPNKRFVDVVLSGYCAWSVYCCMMEGPHTYLDAIDDKDREHGTSLIKEAKTLNLAIEVYSDEPGMGFEEHYLISNSYFNPVLINEEKEVESYWLENYETVEEFNEENNKRMDEDYFKLLKENEMEYKEGGFGCADFVLNQGQQPIKVIMAKKVKKTEDK